MAESIRESGWGVLGLAGALGLCCVGTAALAGGAAIAGSATAGATAMSDLGGSFGGILVSALATALPLFVIGLALR